MAIFSRIGRLINGFLSLFVSGLERRNPEALMEAARQEFRDRMAHYNQALARMAGIAERLKSQIKSKTDKAQDLQRRIMANYRAGNQELAGSLARELQEMQSDMSTDTAELKETEEGYQANLRQAKIAQQEFEDKINRLDRQLSQVKVKEAQAEASAALNNVAFKVGDMGDTMKTVEDVLQKRYEVSAGKARLAKDMVDIQQINEKEGERKALEKNALADFLASQGIQAPELQAAPQASKEIGPSQQVSEPGKEIGPAQPQNEKQSQ